MARVAEVSIFAKLFGDKKVQRDWKRLQDDLNRNSERTHKREMSRARDREKAFESLKRTMSRVGKGGDVFSTKNAAAMRKAVSVFKRKVVDASSTFGETVRKAGRLHEMDSAEAAKIFRNMMRKAGRGLRKDVIKASDIFARTARRSGQMFRKDFANIADRFGSRMRVSMRGSARDFGRFLGHEVVGVFKKLPGVAQAGNAFRGARNGGILGTIIGKTVLGPGDLLALPTTITQFLRRQLPGLLVMGIPVLVREAVNLVGAAVAAIPPIFVGALAVMNQGVIDLARTTGQTVASLRGALTFGTFSGMKSREEAMKFFDVFDQASAGGLKRTKSGALTAASEEAFKKMQRLKDFKFGPTGPTVFDTILNTKDIDKRMAIFGEALERLRSGKATTAAGKKIGRERGEAISRELANAVGPEFAKAMLKSADEARRRGISLTELFRERRQQSGFFSDATITNIDRATDAIGKLFRVLSGTGVEIANRHMGDVSRWLENLAEGLSETKMARVDAFSKVFDRNRDAINRWFRAFANPEAVISDPDSGEVMRGFFDFNGRFVKEDPRLKMIRDMGDSLAKLAGRAGEAVETLGKLSDVVSAFTNSKSAGVLDRFAESTLGGGLGFIKGLVKAFDLPEFKMDRHHNFISDADGNKIKTSAADRMNEILFHILRGAGATNVSRENASRRLGNFISEFFSMSLNRAALMFESTGQFLQGFDKAIAGGIEGQQGSKLTAALGRFATALSSSFAEVMRFAFDKVGENDGLISKLLSFGEEAGKAIGKGVVKGFGESLGSLFVDMGKEVALALSKWTLDINRLLDRLPFLDRTAQIEEARRRHAQTFLDARMPETVALRSMPARRQQRSALDDEFSGQNQVAGDAHALRAAMVSAGQVVSQGGDKINSAGDKMQQAAATMSAAASKIASFSPGPALAPPAPPEMTMRPVPKRPTGVQTPVGVGP